MSQGVDDFSKAPFQDLLPLKARIQHPMVPEEGCTTQAGRMLHSIGVPGGDQGTPQATTQPAVCRSSSPRLLLPHLDGGVQQGHRQQAAIR
jgi:hypothetical protein